MCFGPFVQRSSRGHWLGDAAAAAASSARGFGGGFGTARYCSGSSPGFAGGFRAATRSAATRSTSARSAAAFSAVLLAITPGTPYAMFRPSAFGTSDAPCRKSAQTPCTHAPSAVATSAPPPRPQSTHDGDGSIAATAFSSASL